MVGRPSLTAAKSVAFIFGEHGDQGRARQRDRQSESRPQSERPQRRGSGGNDRSNGVVIHQVSRDIGIRLGRAPALVEARRMDSEHRLPAQSGLTIKHPIETSTWRY